MQHIDYQYDVNIIPWALMIPLQGRVGRFRAVQIKEKQRFGLTTDRTAIKAAPAKGSWR